MSTKQVKIIRWEKVIDVDTFLSLLLKHSTVMTLLLFFSLDQWFSTRGDFVPQETLAMSEDIFSCHT